MFRNASCDQPTINLRRDLPSFWSLSNFYVLKHLIKLFDKPFNPLIVASILYYQSRFVIIFFSWIAMIRSKCHSTLIDDSHGWYEKFPWL